MNVDIIKKKAFLFVTNGMIYTLLIGLSFVFLYPFLFMISTSFKSYQDLMDVSINWIPRGMRFENYKVAFDSLYYWTAFKNSLVQTSISTFAHIIVCSFVGYGFARFRFPFRNFCFFIVVLSILIPAQILIVPQYIFFVPFNLTRTLWPMIIPTFLGYGLKGGLFIFIYRQYYLRLPKSLEEAARIDGCGPIRAYFKVVFPSATSTTVVTLILSMVWHWNDYFEPGVYLKSTKDFLLPQNLPGLYEMIASMESAVSEKMALLKFTYHEGVVMAATLLVTMPLLVVYLFLQRKFVEGVERSGMVE